MLRRVSSARIVFIPISKSTLVSKIFANAGRKVISGYVSPFSILYKILENNYETKNLTDFRSSKLKISKVFSYNKRIYPLNSAKKIRAMSLDTALIKHSVFLCGTHITTFNTNCQ